MSPPRALNDELGSAEDSLETLSDRYAATDPSQLELEVEEAAVEEGDAEAEAEADIELESAEAEVDQETKAEVGEVPHEG